MLTVYRSYKSGIEHLKILRKRSQDPRATKNMKEEGLILQKGILKEIKPEPHWALRNRAVLVRKEGKAAGGVRGEQAVKEPWTRINRTKMTGVRAEKS